MKLLVIFISALGVILSVFYIASPAAVIELQRRFYEKINWIMTPVSMPKEIRNTRAMGVLLAAVSVSIAFLILFS